MADAVDSSSNAIEEDADDIGVCEAAPAPEIEVAFSLKEDSDGVALMAKVKGFRIRRILTFRSGKVEINDVKEKALNAMGIAALVSSAGNHFTPAVYAPRNR